MKKTEKIKRDYLALRKSLREQMRQTRHYMELAVFAGQSEKAREHLAHYGELLERETAAFKSLPPELWCQVR